MSAVATDGTPGYPEYMNPLLDVLRREGRSLPIEELDRLVIIAMGLSPAVVAIPHDPDKPDRSKVGYKLAWVRSYLKKAGFVANTGRGQWGLTDRGRTAGAIDAPQVWNEIAQIARAGRAAPEGARQETGEEPAEDVPDEELVTARVGIELERELRALHQELASAGQLLDEAEAARSYRRFRELFGPEVLAGLDGEALLLRIHGRSTARDSLAYWLEFKDDEEFPARFGSIGGGSALKFGIYQAAETGQWTTGNSRQLVRLTLDEAVARARSQRDEFVAGARVLGAQPADPMSIDFPALQESLATAAPELAETSWGHKYFSLLYPTILAPIHGKDYQEHQLYKLIKLPGSGRYENARYFVGIARQLSISLLDLAHLLHRRSGGPHRYWRVGTTVDDRSEWERMRAGGFMAIGWDAIGDLSSVSADGAGKDEIRKRLEQHWPKEAAGTLTKGANQIFQFLNGAQERDLVLAMEGARVRGVGRVVGGYRFQPDDGPFPHRRAVEWLRDGEWRLPELEGLRTTFVPIKKPANIVETEGRLLGSSSKRITVAPSTAVAPPLPPLAGVVGRIDAVLQRKRQVVLYGPPGTGKTFWAERAVEELAARGWFGVEAARLEAHQRQELRERGAIEVCSFHPAYGYEDFLEGFRPAETSGALSFQLRDGLFKRLCIRAASSPRQPFFLIVDEINRGDIPRIFGELLTVLEKEKRTRSVTLPLSGTAFAVPDNVYMVGTMNTADRSIALLDAALRRRFGFVELLPDSSTLAGVSIAGLPIGAWLDELNRRIVEHVGRDARHLQVGHSYLLSGTAPVRDLSRFAEILRDDILPLLEEYCYEDMEALERILGPTIVQRARQRIDSGLFEPGRHADLIQALLSAFEGITITRQAAEATDAPVESDEDDEDDEPPGAPGA